jgi:hypothetical protein
MTTTDKQIAANRENAKKSTGPKTAAGKAKVSLNPLKHGLLAKAALLPDEDPKTFQSFADELLDDLQPVGAVESLLADKIVNLAWRLQRVSLVESGLFVREQAIADEEWFRAEKAVLEVTHDDLRSQAFGVGETPFFERPGVCNIIDLECHGALTRQVMDAQERKRSQPGRLGDAFARDAAGGNAFSKLGRYETAIARQLKSAMGELGELQEKRKSSAPP